MKHFVQSRLCTPCRVRLVRTWRHIAQDLKFLCHLEVPVPVREASPAQGNSNKEGVLPARVTDVVNPILPAKGDHLIKIDCVSFSYPAVWALDQAR